VENVVAGDRSERRTYLRSGESGIDNPSESWDDFDVRSQGPSSTLPGKGVIAGSTVFERPDKIRTARRRASGKTERSGGTREERRLRADTIPEEPSSISEAVTSAERASFPGNRKLRRTRRKCRQATYRVVLCSFHSSLKFRPFYFLSYDPRRRDRFKPSLCRFTPCDSSDICRKQLGTIYLYKK